MGGVLFVCTNNICRSPTAEAVFRAAAEREGIAHLLRIGSAGTHGFHAGEPPDPRAIRAARGRGYDIASLRARQVGADDFIRFDRIFAMDRTNLAALAALRPEGHAGHVGLFLDVVPDAGVRDVADPYFAGAAAFERVLDLVEPASQALAAQLARTLPR